MNPALTETIAAFMIDSTEYEIDHLGLTDPAQWGHCTVYRAGTRHQRAAFVVPEAGPWPGRRSDALRVTEERLVELATAALGDR
jgi:hypothetical protein